MGMLTKAISVLARGLGLSDPRLYHYFTGGPTAAGETVTVNTALQLDTVWACVRLLSQTVATLPLFFYTKDAKGRGIIDDSHPLYRILHDHPNADMTATEFWEAMVASVLLWGNAYGAIERTGIGTASRVVAITPMRPDRVTIQRQEDGSLLYRYNFQGFVAALQESDVFHLKGFSLDGLVGISPVAMGRESIAAAIAAEKASASFFRNGMRASAVMTSPTFIPKDQRERFNTEFVEKFTGSINAGKIPILEGGFKVEPLQMPPEDAQLLATRSFHVEQICFAPGTEIVTPGGPRPIEKISVGDLVMTHKGRWRRVNHVMSRPYVGKVVTVQAKGLDPVTATAEHPFRARITKMSRLRILQPDETEVWCEAGDLIPGIVHKHGRSRRPFHNLVIPRLAVDETARTVDLKEWFPSAIDGTRGETIRATANSRARDLPRTVKADYPLAWLCGLYVADGSSTADQVVFYLGAHETALTEQLRATLLDVFAMPSTTTLTDGGVARTVASSHILAAFFRQFGHVAHAKRFSPWCMAGSQQFRDGLIDGVVAGDGCHYKRDTNLHTTSYDLAWQVRLLLWAKGINSGLETVAESQWEIGGRSGVARENWTVRWREMPIRRGTMGIADESVFFALKRADHATYSGPVFNLEVEEDESYVTLGGAVHNCRWFDCPPAMIGHTEKSTAWGTGLEQMMLWFLTFSLRPHLKRIEQAIHRDLLTPQEQANSYAEFNVEGLLRADSHGRAVLYKMLADTGLRTRNELRELDNEPPIPGGDDLTVMSNMLPIQLLGEFVRGRADKPLDPNAFVPSKPLPPGTEPAPSRDAGPPSE